MPAVLHGPPSPLPPRRGVPNSSWLSFSRAGQLRDLDTNFKAIHLKQLSDSPKNLQGIAAAKEIINQAIAVKLPFSPEGLESAGASFVEAGAKTPNVWDAALSFLTYRSMLSVSFAPPKVDPQPVPKQLQNVRNTHILAAKGETKTK